MMHSMSLLLSAALAGGAPSHATVPTAPPVVTIRAREYSFVAPKTVKSGANTFRLVNEGKELHHLTIIRLDKGKTMADLAAAMRNPGPLPAWTTDVGGPNPALPGGSAEATLSLDAGNYVIVCFVPSPGETAPHVMKGMMGEFTVVPEKSGGSVPAADATIHMSDYAFTIDKPLAAGHHVLNVTNDAVQAHELVLAELPPGKTVADLGNWVEKSLMKGPPPGKPVGGMAALGTGRSGTFPIDLKPGRYGMICFLPDAKDGKTHFVHGMTKEFTVAAK
jgi:uncharacterized cupredoxin-like copper-binding protein